MAAADRLVYPASPVWRNPEAAFINAAASVFVAAFAAIGVAAVVGGAVTGRAQPVIFGVLWCAVFGYVAWTAVHLASRLEFVGGCLSWRATLPWFPMMRPGRVKAIRWPASPRSRYVRIELDGGRKLSVLPRRVTSGSACGRSAITAASGFCTALWFRCRCWAWWPIWAWL